MPDVGSFGNIEELKSNQNSDNFEEVDKEIDPGFVFKESKL